MSINEIGGSYLKFFSICGLCLTFYSAAQGDDRHQARRDFGYADAVAALQAIDAPRNATALKVSYFMRPQEQDPPPTEVYGLVKDAIKVETVGSKKWFFLENVRAFAAFRIPRIDPSEGFESYGLIFDNAKLASNSDAGYVLFQSINEFVDAVPTKLHSLGFDTDERTRLTLFKAWSAYCIASSAKATGTRKYVVSEPHFSRALEAAEGEDDFIELVEKSLNDKTAPRTFGVLRTVALAVADTAPDKAISLLREAKSLIPRNGDPVKGQANINEAAVVYDKLVDLLLSHNKISDAIAEQKERVKLIGTGQGKLLSLLIQSGDTVGSDEILKSLSLPDADQREVIRAADGLSALSSSAEHPNPKAKENAVALLEAYLASDRAKIADYDLAARLRLGRYYRQKGQIEKARAILKFGELSKPISSNARVTLQQIATEVKRLNEMDAAQVKKELKANTPSQSVAGNVTAPTN